MQPSLTMQRIFLALFSLLLQVMSIEGKVMASMVDVKDADLVIPNQYIVVLSHSEEDSLESEGVDPLQEHTAWLTTLIGNNGDMEVQHTFNIEGLKGYTGKFSSETIDEIRKRPEVKYVEPDQLVYALDLVDGQPRRRLIKEALHGMMGRRRYKHGRRAGSAPRRQRFHYRRNKDKKRVIRRIRNQRDATWGLSRVSHGELPFELNKYHYPRSAGKGVDVYVIDTGINVAHVDFEGRAKWGITIPDGDIDIDGNGHGTHCAGTIGSRTYGIAKKANVIAVKVLRTNGFGTNADVIKGVEWTIKAARKAAAKGKRSAANMSLGGGRSLTLEYVVNRAVKSGVHFAVAAGNDNEDACQYSPAAAEGPITVGATTNKDKMAFFSNHGPCVDIFAPGMDITSTWIGHGRAINTISGTSMASPHVAGVLALYLGEKNYDTKTLKKLLIKHANEGILEGLPEDSENLLLCTRKLLETFNGDA